MGRWNRGLATLVAAAAAGFLIWFAPHFNRWTTGGYWGVIGLMALGGLLIGVSQLHGRDGNPTASFLLVFLPVLVATGWVILAAEPQGSWVRDHVLSWSGDIGIGHAVHNLGEHVAVLGIGLGVVFGLTFEPKMVRRGRKKAAVASTAEVAALSPSPVPADRVAEEATVVEPPAQSQQVDAAPTVEPAGSSAPRGSGDAEAEDERPTVVEPPAPEPEGSEPEAAGPPA
jgi:hypothetical protein